MLDKSIPFARIIMKRDKCNDVPLVELPDGFSFCLYKPGDEKAWAAIEASVLEFDDEQAALEHFNGAFSKHTSELEKRCLFIENKNGDKVATAMAWWDDSGGKRVARLHWIAVHPEYQGLGLGKAIISKTVALALELEGNGDIYLMTQTWSYKAIGIYKQFGFYITDEKGSLNYDNADYEKALEILKSLEVTK